MYKEIFAKRLKEARKNAGLTQKQVEELTGITQSNITKYETERLEPNIETLGTLAELYNVTTDWLIGIGRKTDSETQNTNLKELKERGKILNELEKEGKKGNLAI